MLLMKPVKDPMRVYQLFLDENLPVSAGCGAFMGTDDGVECGYTLFRLDGQMTFFVIRCAGDVELEILLRGALNYGSLSGCEFADFSAIEGEMRQRILDRGYLTREPLPIEWFFENCKPCHGFGK